VRRPLLLLPLVAVIASSCSGGGEKTFAFDETAACLREGGLHPIVGKPRWTLVPARDLGVSDGLQMNSLVFFKSAVQAKDWYVPSLPELPGVRTAAGLTAVRRGNVILLSGESFPPVDVAEMQVKAQKTIYGCLS